MTFAYCYKSVKIMGFEKPQNKKEYVCRMCGKFLDANELTNNGCPNCDTDENIYLNDLNDEDE